MCHSGKQDKVNKELKVYDRALRILYGEYNFQELLKIDNPGNIHQKKLRFHAIKVCQVKMGLSPLMTETFHN